MTDDANVRIRRFLADELGSAVSYDALTDDLMLIEQEIIDSQAIFTVIDFLEREFGIEIEDEELLPENFESIGAMVRLVRGKADSSPA